MYPLAHRSVWLHTFANSYIQMSHKFGQSSKGFIKLCFIEFKGSVDKWLNKWAYNTNTYKYKGPSNHFDPLLIVFFV